MTVDEFIADYPLPASHKLCYKMAWERTHLAAVKSSVC